MTTATEVEISGESLLKVIDFEPNSGYQKAILESTHRFIQVSGGEQSGKSRIVSMKILQEWDVDMAKNPGDGDGVGDPILYWLIGRAYSETRREFWYLVDALKKIFKGSVKHTTRLDPGYIELTFPGDEKPRLRIETKSGKDVMTMSQDAPHGIVLCEAGQHDLIVFERARGRCTPKDAWLFLPGTMEFSTGWFPSLGGLWKSGADNRKSFLMPSHANKHLYPGGKNDPKILALKRDSTDEFYSERIEGIPVPPKGLVIPEFRVDIHVQSNYWVPGEKVYLWEDPGLSDSYHALEIAHIIAGQVRIFDEVYYKGKVIQEIIDIAMGRPWWTEKDKILVADVYVEQRHSQRPLSQIWQQEAALTPLNVGKLRIVDGILRARVQFKMDPETHGPKIIIDPSCQGLISELGGAPNPDTKELQAYRWATDRQGNTVGTTPQDRHNDAIKALTYGLIQHFGYTRKVDDDVIRVHRRNGSRRNRRR